MVTQLPAALPVVLDCRPDCRLLVVYVSFSCTLRRCSACGALIGLLDRLLRLGPYFFALFVSARCAPHQRGLCAFIWWQPWLLVGLSFVLNSDLWPSALVLEGNATLVFSECSNVQESPQPVCLVSCARSPWLLSEQPCSVVRRVLVACQSWWRDSSVRASRCSLGDMLAVVTAAKAAPPSCRSNCTRIAMCMRVFAHGLWAAGGPLLGKLSCFRMGVGLGSVWSLCSTGGPLDGWSIVRNPGGICLCVLLVFVRCKLFWMSSQGCCASSEVLTVRECFGLACACVVFGGGLLV
jgi:hypothetical protein